MPIWKHIFEPNPEQVIVSCDVIFLSEVIDTPAPEESFELFIDRMMQLKCNTSVDSGRDGEVIVDIPLAAPGNTTDKDIETSEESKLVSSVDKTNNGSANVSDWCYGVFFCAPSATRGSTNDGRVQRVRPGKYSNYDMTCSILSDSVPCLHVNDEPQSYAETMRLSRVSNVQRDGGADQPSGRTEGA